MADRVEEAKTASGSPDALALRHTDIDSLSGEALALDTAIPTPDGWATMADVQIGDLVFDGQGQSVPTVSISVIHVGRPCWRVTFSDGTSVVTDENHLWAARDSRQRSYKGPPSGGLTRAQRFPSHEVLEHQLAQLRAYPGRTVTVSEYEAELGNGRLALLRRGLNHGSLDLKSVGRRESVAGRFPAREFRFDDITRALLDRLRSSPRWFSAEPQIVTTADMARTLRGYGAAINWSIDVTQPIELPELKVPVDPWLLGYWLGDGARGAAAVATADTDVIDRIKQLGYRVTHYARYNYGLAAGSETPSLKVALRSLGVLLDKHVPPRYLRGSIQQRAELLAGLLDSDGTAAVRSRFGGTPSGQVSFVNTNRALIDSVAELAASLGFIPTITQTRFEGDVETGSRSVAHGSRLLPAWTVRFTPDRQVFGIARKQAMLEPSLTAARRATTSRRYVVDLAPVESVPVKCIAVDSDTHLYLATRRFIPTHDARHHVGKDPCGTHRRALG